MIHGHGSHGDQLFTRADIRDAWLPTLLASGAGIVTPNLRDNAWMSPAAATDLHALIPVEQARQLAAAMAGRPTFEYVEIPGGGHDSPLWDRRALACLVRQLARFP